MIILAFILGAVVTGGGVVLGLWISRVNSPLEGDEQFGSKVEGFEAKRGVFGRKKGTVEVFSPQDKEVVKKRKEVREGREYPEGMMRKGDL